MTKAELEQETALGKQILTAPDAEVAGLCRRFYAVDDRLYVANAENLRRARGNYSDRPTNFPGSFPPQCVMAYVM